MLNPNSNNNRLQAAPPKRCAHASDRRGFFCFSPKLRKLSGCRGTSAIEFAIILPVLLVFLLGIMDTGRLLWVYNTLHRATDAAARCASINPIDCATTAQIQSKAADSAWGMSIPPSDFTVSYLPCCVLVNVSQEFKFTVPGLSDVSLTSSSRYPK